MALPLALSTLLIVYGSLFPFEYAPHVTSLGDWVELLFNGPRELETFDVVGNVILFVPHGIFIARLRIGQRQVFGFFASVLLAWLIQYAQFWFPGRDPAGSDAWANTLGLGLGWMLGRPLEAIFKNRATWARKNEPWWQASAALVLAWTAYRWFPLVPSLDVQNFKDGIKPLLSSSRPDPVRILHDAAAWLVFFRLASYSVLERLSPAAATALGLVILGAEPLFLSNHLSLANLAGFALAAMLMPIGVRRRYGLFAVLGLQLLSICLSELEPFKFNLQAPRSFQWLPFGGMLQGNMHTNLAALLEKSFLYAGTVVLAAQCGANVTLAGIALAMLLLPLELMQTLLPVHVPEITDPVLALLAGLALRPLMPPARPKRASVEPAFRVTVEPAPDSAPDWR